MMSASEGLPANIGHRLKLSLKNPPEQISRPERPSEPGLGSEPARLRASAKGCRPARCTAAHPCSNLPRSPHEPSYIYLGLVMSSLRRCSLNPASMRCGLAWCSGHASEHASINVASTAIVLFDCIASATGTGTARKGPPSKARREAALTSCVVTAGTRTT